MRRSNTSCHPPSLRPASWAWAGLTLPVLMLAGCGGGTSASDEDTTSAKLVAGSSKHMQAAAAITAAVSSYYIDSRTGNDSADGSAASPWRSLSRLSTVQLKGGDSIYLACGATWRESLALASPLAASGITITSFGSSCTTSTLPVISGADDLSGGWTRNGNIWVRSVPTTLPKITRLFIDGVAQRTAQWPNYGGIGKEFALTDSAMVASNTVLQLKATDASTLSNLDLVGATVLIRSKPWYIEKMTAKSFSPATRQLTLSSSTYYSTVATSGYILADKQWMLDSAGEFFHDTVNRKLYVYPSTAAAQSALNSSVVEGSVRDVALSLTGVDGATVKSIQIEKARTDGMVVNDSSGIDIQRIKSQQNGVAGLRVIETAPPAAPARSGRIFGSTFNDNYETGIHASAAPNFDITSNQINNTGTGTNVGNTRAAIFAGDGAIVSNNGINYSAYIGIRYSPVGGSQITGNTVYAHCMRLSDCGAIYTWFGAATGAQYSNQSSTVTSNRIFPASANTDGTAASSSSLVAGIYLDDNTLNATVTGNVIDGVPYSVFIHNGSTHTVKANQLWLPGVAAVAMNMDQTTNDAMTGNVITDNEIVPVAAASGGYPTPPKFRQSLIYWYVNTSSTSGGTNIGSNTISANRIARVVPLGSAYAYINSGGVGKYLSEPAWLALNPADGTPTVPATYATFSPSLSTELLSSGTFSAGLGAWYGSFPSTTAKGSLTLANGSVGCEGNCARFTTATTSDTLLSPAFTLPTAGLYQLSFDRGFIAANAITLQGLARTTSPWDSLIDTTSVKTPYPMSGDMGDSGTNTLLFTATKSGTGIMGLRLQSNGKAVTFDNLSLRQVLGYSVASVSDWVRTVHASAGTASTVTCTSLGWPSNCAVMNLSGNAIALPATVPAGSSAIYLRADSPWRR